MHVLFGASLLSQPVLPVPRQFAGAIFLAPMLPAVMLALLSASLVLGLLVRGSIFFNRRHKEIRSMALRLGLRPYPDNSLPLGLSLHGTSFFRSTKLSNIYEGVLNRNEVVILDFLQVEFDSSWARTIVAVKGKDEIEVPPSFEYRKAGAWHLIYSPVGLMNSRNLLDADRIELIIKNLVH